MNLIRERVKKWREQGWPGVTRTTRDLLAYWSRDGRQHRLFFAQIEAAETIIFLTEARTDFRQGIEVPRDEPSDEVKARGFSGFLRYACKMATHAWAWHPTSEPSPPPAMHHSTSGGSRGEAAEIRSATASSRCLHRRCTIRRRVGAVEGAASIRSATGSSRPRHRRCTKKRRSEPTRSSALDHQSTGRSRVGVAGIPLGRGLEPSISAATHNPATGRSRGADVGLPLGCGSEPSTSSAVHHSGWGQGVSPNGVVVERLGSTRSSRRRSRVVGRPRAVSGCRLDRLLGGCARGPRLRLLAW